MHNLASLKILLLALCASASAQFVLHHSRAAPPSGYTHQGPAPAGQTLGLRVALASNDMAGLEGKLLDISDPASPNYAKWLSADELQAYLQPPSATTAAFNSFAQENGLRISASPMGDWVQFTTTVEHANALFNASYQTFVHQGTSQTLTRTLSYSLPQALVGHVKTVLPTTSFDARSPRFIPTPKQQAKRVIASSCNNTITPTCLQDLYVIPKTPVYNKDNTLLVTAYGNQWAERSDLAAFLALERPDMDPSTTYTVISVDNGTDPQGPEDAGIEANLDIQYTVGLATDVPVELLTNGNTVDYIQAFIDTNTYLASTPSPPSVMSTSYGIDEDEFSLSDAQILCAGYMALGARGISVIFASGDGGVRGNPDYPDRCPNNTFIPVFPPSCPYVTSVGSTVGIDPERAINFTGGGFSNYFPRPAWQNQVISSFLDTVPSSFPGVFNRSGRGYPDVATQGLNFEVYVNSELKLIWGTSASSPTFASIIAIINDRLSVFGRPPLGFLNPFLYQFAGPAGAFNDITVGKNVGFSCNDSAVAFSAQKGWDPTTGFGTPNYPKLLIAAGIKSIF